MIFNKELSPMTSNSFTDGIRAQIAAKAPWTSFMDTGLSPYCIELVHEWNQGMNTGESLGNGGNRMP